MSEDAAALIVHPVNEEGREFVRDSLDEKVRELSSDRPVYGLEQEGRNDDLVGSNYYRDTFSDLNGRGKPCGEMFDEVEEYGELYIGGGQFNPCVASCISSFNFRGRTRNELVVGKEISYGWVEDELRSAGEIIDSEGFDEEDILSSVYYGSRIESIF